MNIPCLQFFRARSHDINGIVDVIVDATFGIYNYSTQWFKMYDEIQQLAGHR